LPIGGEHLVCLVNTTHPMVVGPDGLGAVNLGKKKIYIKFWQWTNFAHKRDSFAHVQKEYYITEQKMIILIS